MDHDEIAAVVGSVLGQVLGDSTIGRHRHHGHHHHHHAHHGLKLPPKPGWRANAGELPTGVNAPSEGMEPLTLKPDVNGGTFTAAVTNIEFIGKPQAPFQGERLLAQVLRNGTTANAAAALCTGIFVGRELQQVQRGNLNLEFFAPTAFGVRLIMSPAAAGLEVSLPCILSSGLTDTDTLNVQLLILGHTLR